MASGGATLLKARPAEIDRRWRDHACDVGPHTAGLVAEGDHRILPDQLIQHPWRVHRQARPYDKEAGDASWARRCDWYRGIGNDRRLVEGAERRRTGRARPVRWRQLLGGDSLRAAGYEHVEDACPAGAPQTEPPRPRVGLPAQELPHPFAAVGRGILQAALHVPRARELQDLHHRLLVRPFEQTGELIRSRRRAGRSSANQRFFDLAERKP